MYVTACTYLSLNVSAPPCLSPLCIYLTLCISLRVYLLHVYVASCVVHPCVPLHHMYVLTCVCPTVCISLCVYVPSCVCPTVCVSSCVCLIVSMSLHVYAPTRPGVPPSACRYRAYVPPYAFPHRAYAPASQRMNVTTVCMLSVGISHHMFIPPCVSPGVCMSHRVRLIVCVSSLAFPSISMSPPSRRVYVLESRRVHVTIVYVPTSVCPHPVYIPASQLVHVTTVWMPPPGVVMSHRVYIPPCVCPCVCMS